MTTITLSISEFINFKQIFKERFFSEIKQGKVKITANAIALAALGYL